MRKAVPGTAVGIFSVLALYFLAALIGAVIPGSGFRASGEDVVEVHLIRGPIHYDFLIPLTAETRERLGDLNDAGVPLDGPRAQGLLIGWGAQEFYTTTGTYSDVALGAVFKGLAGDRSVLRTDVVGRLPTDLDLPGIRMNPEQFARFLNAIEASFARSDQGRLVPLNATGFSATDRFFAARGTFNLFQTCNVWIGQILRAAEVRFGLWVPLPYSVTLSHWLFQSQ